MNIFSSGWLQRMVDKAGKTPEARIQALFQILQDWVDVPGIRQQIQEVPLDESGRLALKEYLLHLVSAAGVTSPDMVADQLHMILLGALNEEIRQSGSQALECAGKAAALLVTAQLQNRRMSHNSNLAIAASVILMASMLTLFVTRQQPEPIAVRSVQLAAAASAPSPERIASLYQLHEQMQAASCLYPQALMMPPEQRAPFLENVVNGRVGNIRPETIDMVSQLYKKVDCYYPPAAMLL